MRTILNTKFLPAGSKHFLNLFMSYFLLSNNAPASGAIHFEFLIYYCRERILNSYINKIASGIIRNTLMLIFISATSVTSGQDVLVGLTSNGGAEGKGTAYSIKTDGSSFNIIKGFSDWGSYPVNDLVQAPDGNFYGMTPEGGTYNHGTLFKVTSGGQLTVLKHFNLTVDGGYPRGSLIVGKDGALYGTTSGGGPNYGGVIFKITTAGIYTILRSLNTNSEGGHPYGHLVQAADGNFYGITYSGGVNSYGTVFKMSATGTTYTVLKAFKGGTDGGSSYGSLVQGSDGAFYGMTYLGGTSNRGIIFRITSSGAYTILRNLDSTTDGQYPFGDLIQAKDGYLYGMIYQGGINYSGTIFKINTTGTTFTIVKALSGTTGGNPHGSLIQATDGSLYGMTYYSPTGGSSTAGSVFKMTTSGTMTIVKKFTLATEGGCPLGGLIQAKDGNFYGMTSQGGKNDNGTIFKVKTDGALTVLSHLNNDVSGTNPQENLAIGKDSAYFGVTQNGGLYDAGTIFKICGGVTTVLRSLKSSADGGYPAGGLARDKDGNLYGTTESGGTGGVGTIFKISPSGTYTVLHHFKGATDGVYSKSTLVQGTDGAFYGTTSSGGTGSAGTIFKITSGGAFTVLHHIVPSTEGSDTEAGLVLAKDGFLYGVTGTNTRFFKISTSGAFTVLHTFVYNSEGGTPAGALTIGTDGAFYGTNIFGGSNTHGTIFKLSSAGAITILRQLSGPADGSFPKGGLVQGTDGAFYGTTSSGGKYSSGTIFRITSGKTFSILRHLNIPIDGGAATGGLILAPKITLTAISQTNVTTAEDVAKSITLSGTGSTSATYMIVAQPKNGSVSSGTGAGRTYTPKANYNGKDSFAFTTNTGCLASAPAWVIINVTAVNDAPVLATIGNKTIAAGSKLSFIATAKDADSGQTKKFSLVSAPSGAVINAGSGAFTWTSATAGSYTFKVKVLDNGSPVLSDEEQITVTVTAQIAAKAAIIKKADIPENSMIAKASIFPNPVINNFTVGYDKPINDVTIKIINLNGSVLYTKKFEKGDKQQLQVEAADLKPGQYLLQLQSDNTTQVLKFIKM